MSQIGNRFYVTALEDGTTLHGNLVATGSLSQGWNGESAIPDWTVAANQPTIYLTLLSGNSYVEAESTFTWKYNGTTIVFGSDNISTTPAGLFQKTTYSVNGVTMPALKIISNLAGISESGHPNVDTDTITFEGSFLASGASIPFTCSAFVRITSLSAGSYLGVIEFANGISNITEKGQTLTLTGKLYGPNGSQITSGVTTTWWLNDFTGSGTTGSTFTVSESSVVDHAIVQCKFTYDSAERYTCYESIDDMQDPEYMYIQYNGENGNAASLRSGQTATFTIWVGTRDSANVLGGTATPTYGYIRVKLIDGSGITVGGSEDTSNPNRYSSLATAIPACTGGSTGAGWRDLTVTQGKATITPHYDTVVALGKNMTGIVMASTTAFT